MEIQNVAIDKVFPYIHNPRKNENAVQKVSDSINEFGFRQPIVVDDESVIIAGHTRLEAAKRLGMESVPVHVATGLTPQQVKAYRIADNRIADEADFDWELLKQELEGIENKKSTGFDEDELNEILKGLQWDDYYTKNITSIIYDPFDDKPDISELCDSSKAEQLIEQIENNTELNEGEKNFLKLAAYRHIIFNYSKIADFYAHSGKNTKKIMEESMLVLIDVNKAIEKGYLKLTEDLIEIMDEDYDE